jgi:ribosomal protein S21
MGNFSVEVRSGEPFEKALRRFTSKTRKTGLLRDLKNGVSTPNPLSTRRSFARRASADSRRPPGWSRPVSHGGAMR